MSALKWKKERSVSLGVTTRNKRKLQTKAERDTINSVLLLNWASSKLMGFWGVSTPKPNPHNFWEGTTKAS